MADSTDKLIYCSFCGKSQREVRKLIAGPLVFICDECVYLSMVVLEKEFPGWIQAIQENFSSGDVTDLARSEATKRDAYDLLADYNLALDQLTGNSS